MPLQGRKRAADLRCRSRPLAHRGRCRRLSRHARIRLPFPPPPGGKAKRHARLSRELVTALASPVFAATSRADKFAVDSPLEEAVTSELVSAKVELPLGSLQGISSIRGLCGA